MAKVIKSGALNYNENFYNNEAKVSDVIFGDNFEIVSKDELTDKPLYLRNQVNAISEKADILNSIDYSENIKKSIEESQKLLKDANSALTDARIAYRKAIKKGKEDAKKKLAKQKSRLVQTERKLKKQLKAGFNRGMCNGYEEGFALGKKIAEQERGEQLTAILDKLEKITTYINTKQNEIFESYENELIELAFNIAQKITAMSLEKESDVYINIIKSAISSFKNAQWIEIAVADTEISKKILASKEVLKRAVNSCEDIKVKVFENFEEGKILIETPTEFIEASPEAQLNNIRNKLKSIG